MPHKPWCLLAKKPSRSPMAVHYNGLGASPEEHFPGPMAGMK